jgi:pimeloyl-ACP methyl ester carboxylesterase
LPWTAHTFPEPSQRTKQLLRRYNLPRDVDQQPQVMLASLDDALQLEKAPEKIYAYAELAHAAAARIEQRDEKKAFDLYATSVAHAYKYLFDGNHQAGRNPYDPQFRGACDLYNKSLDRALRIVNRHGGFRTGVRHDCQAGKQTLSFSIVSKCQHLGDHEFDQYEFVSDFRTGGLPNHYHRFGLGVPIIAVRKARDGEDALEKHYPPKLAVPMTAFLRLIPNTNARGPTTSSHLNAVLELYDPLMTPRVSLAGYQVPLESDTTTPLAYFLDKLEYTDVRAATSGFLYPGQTSYRSGLYMLEPYQPGKIPVLLVHGLWSTPIKWMEMFNDLRSVPEIARRYQFWFFFYPTGQPFIYSAATLREELTEIRKLLDPNGRQAALDQMVLVGHSMGGLLAKLQTVESGDHFWSALTEKPFDTVKGDTEALYRLHSTYFFRANPSIRRVITIATPHEGSSRSNWATQWLGRRIISPPPVFAKLAEQLNLQNPDVFGEDGHRLTRNSVEMLAPDSPALKALAAADSAPWVTCHNVIGRVAESDWLGNESTTGDTVVALASAKSADAVSEIVVDAEHNMTHRHPLTILEVRRILLEHVRRSPRRIAPIGHSTSPTATEGNRGTP